MARHGDVFAPCQRWELEPNILAPDWRLERDCVTCAHQYEDKPCPEFRRRLLGLLEPAAGLAVTTTQEV